MQQPFVPSKGECSLFLDACATLNYVKPLVLHELIPGNDIPIRALVVRNFVIKCNEKGLILNSTKTAYRQACMYRNVFRKEFQGKNGISPRAIDRAISNAEFKIKAFFNRIRVHENLSNRMYGNVEGFFRRFEDDPRMARVAAGKRSVSGLPYSGTLPDRTDMEILAQALTFPKLVFLTTDGHFGALGTELESEFGVHIVNQENALEKLRLWGWA